MKSIEDEDTFWEKISSIKFYLFFVFVFTEIVQQESMKDYL